MKIEKEFTVNAPREQVWSFITSPEQVAPCIPGCEEINRVTPSKFQARIRIAVGPIKTTFNVDIETTEERAPEYSAYLTQGEEGSRASRIKAQSSLHLQAVTSQQTMVRYVSEISLIGRLGKFGTGMMQKIADSMGEQFVQALREQIEGGPRPGIGDDTPAQTPTTSTVGVYVLAGAVLALGFLLILMLILE
jgi:carbon monoxide dehydrogenase subunit G